MLIDSTYFFGQLSVPQLELAVVGGARPVLLHLNNFIKKYEPEILQLLLGYELHKNFIAGLQEVVVLEKWTDLLYGKEYTNRNGQLAKWNGLLAYSDGLTVGTYWPEDRVYRVDGAGTYDPASGQRELRDPFLEGKTYRVEERGTGTLTDLDYTKVGITDGFDLSLHDFNLGGVYVVQFTAPVALPTPGTIEIQPIKKSLIANYVYYWLNRYEATKKTASGEKVAEGQNATNWPSAETQAFAWNEMVLMNLECIEFLMSNATVYAEYEQLPYWNRRRRYPYDDIVRKRVNILSTQNPYGI